LTTADTAIINSGTVTKTGTLENDFTISNGGVLQVNGGSFTHIGDADWMHVNTGGSLNVAGGSFNQGTSPLIFQMSGTINVSTGSATFNEVGMFTGGALNLSGGTSTFGALTNTSGATITVSGTGAGTVSGNYNNNDGSLVVSGGTFTVGSFSTATGSSILINGGNLVSGASFAYTAASGFSMTSGSLTLTGTSEFKPIDSFTLNGGTLSAKIVALADGPGSLNINSGWVSVDWSGAGNGIYPGTGSVNFSLTSIGYLLFNNVDLSTFTSSNMLTGGKVTLNGIVSPGDFLVTDNGNGGVVVSLVAVPEPGTVAMLVLTGVGFMVFRRRRA
jgi:hypothetical protein